LPLANVPVYTTPIENHEIAGGEEMLKGKSSNVVVNVANLPRKLERIT
jgi:hypothetical protein